MERNALSMSGVGGQTMQTGRWRTNQAGFDPPHIKKAKRSLKLSLKYQMRFKMSLILTIRIKLSTVLLHHHKTSRVSKRLFMLPSNGLTMHNPPEEEALKCKSVNLKSHFEKLGDKF